ncbi:MAG: hypothetical protein PHY34_00920 [Patescibacteria group bacterium]|nr:hypothetical protein [Patescibacteria group bacterium]MDD5715809.1 hypothetical protein [Patescibacteria group bacterium]
MKHYHVDAEEAQRAVETAAARRVRKRLPRMKLSGARVKDLQRLIIDKGRRAHHA